MCGIVGIYQPRSGPRVSKELLRRMRDKIAYRGPDEAGEYTAGPITLGHRRLSIIDLNTGHQPLTSADGRYTIVFNGEIYNYRELRRTLETHYSFRTASDTEVLLYHFIHHGPEGLSQLNGMFAFAVWDNVAQTLFIARDRFGKKPLYYHQSVSGTVVFASELKSILEYVGETPIDRQALVRYLLFEYIPAEETAFSTIKKLPAGSWMR
ncbi:MAG: asparagine synthetase B family protein, partial [Acidobacteriota bacterium]